MQGGGGCNEFIVVLLRLTTANLLLDRLIEMKRDFLEVVADTEQQGLNEFREYWPKFRIVLPARIHYLVPGKKDGKAMKSVNVA